MVEPMGNETLVELRVGDERLAVRALRRFTAPIGSTLGATFDLADACFFDASGSTVVTQDATLYPHHPRSTTIAVCSRKSSLATT